MLTARIHVEDAGSSYFAESNLFRQADDFINQHVAGTSPGWIEINTGRANGALTLEIARFVEQLDQFLAAQHHVTYSYSLAQYVQRMNLVMNDMDPAGVEIKLGGSPVIWTGVLNESIDGQLLSCIIGLTVVTLILVVWLRSLPLGILASLPVPATLVSYFGLMTLLGIDLNIGTAIISFLVVGIVSDYAVHFLHRVEFGRQQGMAMDRALLFAVEHSGRSIFFNLLVFSLGFLTLLLSEFTPIQHLGALVAMALSISGFMSLFLICLLAPLLLPAATTPEQATLTSKA